jgi:xylan 1,4-beta-xylosidase
VHLRTKVRTRTYTYEYSFDGLEWHPTGVELDAKILSDDYVNQTYGGFFTGAFVGMAAVDYSGYGEVAGFDHFDYTELGDA